MKRSKNYLLVLVDVVKKGRVGSIKNGSIKKSGKKLVKILAKSNS